MSSTSTGKSRSRSACRPERSGKPAGRFFDCVILTQVLQFLSPEKALDNVWTSLAPGWQAADGGGPTELMIY